MHKWYSKNVMTEKANAIREVLGLPNTEENKMYPSEMADKLRSISDDEKVIFKHYSPFTNVGGSGDNFYKNDFQIVLFNTDTGDATINVPPMVLRDSGIRSAGTVPIIETINENYDQIILEFKVKKMKKATYSGTTNYRGISSTTIDQGYTNTSVTLTTGETITVSQNDAVASDNRFCRYNGSTWDRIDIGGYYFGHLPSAGAVLKFIYSESDGVTILCKENYTGTIYNVLKNCENKKIELKINTFRFAKDDYNLTGDFDELPDSFTVVFDNRGNSRTPSNSDPNNCSLTGWICRCNGIKYIYLGAYGRGWVPYNGSLPREELYPWANPWGGANVSAPNTPIADIYIDGDLSFSWYIWSQNLHNAFGYIGPMTIHSESSDAYDNNNYNSPVWEYCIGKLGRS